MELVSEQNKALEAQEQKGEATLLNQFSLFLPWRSCPYKTQPLLPPWTSVAIIPSLDEREIISKLWKSDFEIYENGYAELGFQILIQVPKQCQLAWARCSSTWANRTTFGVRYYWGRIKGLGFSPEFPDFGSLKYLLAPFDIDESYYLSFFEN